LEGFGFIYLQNFFFFPALLRIDKRLSLAFCSVRVLHSSVYFSAIRVNTLGNIAHVSISFKALLFPCFPARFHMLLAAQAPLTLLSLYDQSAACRNSLHQVYKKIQDAFKLSHASSKPRLLE